MVGGGILETEKTIKNLSSIHCMHNTYLSDNIRTYLPFTACNILKLIYLQGFRRCHIDTLTMIPVFTIITLNHKLVRTWLMAYAIQLIVLHTLLIPLYWELQERTYPARDNRIFAWFQPIMIGCHLSIFSSPEPLAHGELLRSLDVRCATSVINNCFKGHLLNYGWILTKHVRNDPYGPL